MTSKLSGFIFQSLAGHQKVSRLLYKSNLRRKVVRVVAAALAVGGVSLTASAAPVIDMGILAGYRMNDGSAVATGTSLDGQGGFQAGGLAFIPFSDLVVFRTGFVYTQRNFELTTGGISSDAELAYFDIPVTAMFVLGDMGGIFAGANVGLKLSDDCNGQDCTNAKSTIVPITFGGHFKIAPQFAAEVYYEMVSGDLYDGIEDSTAVGLNAIITFE